MSGNYLTGNLRKKLNVEDHERISLSLYNDSLGDDSNGSIYPNIQDKSTSPDI